MPSIKISTGFSELLPVKNVAGVIKAMPKNTELWVVGDGPEKNNLEQLAKKLGKTVKFFGRVSNQKARAIMRKSDIFILNSFHEGMPHSLLEALAEKVPVIATKIPAVEEVLTDWETGILVNVDDPIDLAQKINLLLKDKKLQQKLISNGRKLYEANFTWEGHLTRLYNVFNDLVNRNPSSS